MGLFDFGNMSDEQKQALQMGLFTFGTNMMQNSVGQNPSLVGSLGNALPAGLTGYQQSLNASKLQKANQESDPLKFQQQLGEINSPDVQNALLKSKLENRTKDIPTKIREFQAFYQMTPEQQQKYIELERSGLQNQIGSSAIANYNFRNGLNQEEQQKFDATMGGTQTINLGGEIVQIDRQGNVINNLPKTSSPDSSPELKRKQEEQKDFGKQDAMKPMSKIAKKNVSDMVSELSGYYEQLDNNNAVSNTQKSGLSNINAYIGNSTIGQGFGKAFGTENQSLRNKIEITKPALIASIMQATGLTATQLNSEKELKFQITQATDPSLGIEANKAALDNIERRMGKTSPSPDLSGKQDQKNTGGGSIDPLGIRN